MNAPCLLAPLCIRSSTLFPLGIAARCIAWRTEDSTCDKCLPGYITRLFAHLCFCSGILTAVKNAAIVPKPSVLALHRIDSFLKSFTPLSAVVGIRSEKRCNPGLDVIGSRLYLPRAAWRPPGSAPLCWVQVGDHCGWELLWDMFTAVVERHAALRTVYSFRF
jgi:hypothetical protein